MNVHEARRTDRVDGAADPGALRRLRKSLVVTAVVVGVVGLVLDGRAAFLPVIAAYAVAMSLSLAASHHREDLRPWLAMDGLIGVAAVVASGGATSPLLLCLIGPMLLAGILRSVGVTALLLVTAAPTVFVDGSAAQGASVFGILVATAIIGSSAEALLAPRRAHDAALAAATAAHERVAQLTELLGTLEQQLGEGGLLTTPRARLLTARRWLALVDEPDVIALRSGDGPEAPWQVLGADDELRPAGTSSLPQALLDGATFDAIRLLPSIAPGTGLDPTSQRAAYLWLSSTGETPEVIGLEWAVPGPFNTDAERFLTQLRALFDLHRSAEDHWGRLQRLNERTERSAMAAIMHDQLAQDLVYTSMELERAARRYPEDPALAQLVPVLRGAVGTVRTTISGLRRAADPVDVPLGVRLTDALGLEVERAHPGAGGGVAAPVRSDVLDAVVEVANRCVEQARSRGARSLSVRDLSDTCPRVEIVAAGIGVDAGEPAIRLLAARADEVGVRLSVTFGPGRGTRFLLEGSG